jgi:anti-sigma regulatory factor (Ser/Thr protein kinase)
VKEAFLNMKKDQIGAHTIQVAIPSNPKYLRALRALIKEITHEMGYTPKNRSEIIHAVDEAITNVIKHGYEGKDHKAIIVTLEEKTDRLVIHIRDFGKKAPLQFIRPRQLHEVRPGGLGVFFIKRHMDEVIYDTGFRTGTELTLVKYLKKRRKKSSRSS